TLDADDGSAGFCQPAQQRSSLSLTADEPLVLGKRPIGRDRPSDDIGPEAVGEGRDGGASVSIERRLIAGELLPTPLSDDVLAERAVQFFRFAEVGSVQQQLGLRRRDANGRRAEPTVDEGADGRARARSASFAEDSPETTAGG